MKRNEIITFVTTFFGGILCSSVYISFLIPIEWISWISVPTVIIGVLMFASRIDKYHDKERNRWNRTGVLCSISFFGAGIALPLLTVILLGVIS